MNLISNKDLFDLVKSLSKSEKRFLKLNASANSISNDLILYFNTIEEAPEYHEDLFSAKNKSKHEKIDVNSKQSALLYDFILLCLRNFHTESSSSYIIKDEITNILNLFDKAQYKQSRKILNKQKQEAYRFEKFHFVLELIGLEKMLMTIETQFNIQNNTIDNLLCEEKEVIEKARNLGEYTVLFSKINMMTRMSMKAKTKNERQEVDAFLNSPLLKKNIELKSKKALVIYHHCRLILCSRNQENELREKECLALIKIMDENPEMIEEMPKRYLIAINNLISIAYENQKFKTCHNYIKQLRSKENLKAFNTTDLQLKIFTSTYNAELITYTDSGLFKKAEPVVAEIEKKLNLYKGKINKEEVLIFYYNIAIMHTYAQQYDLAYKYITAILNEGDKQLRQDLQTFAKIINIGLLYELNNFKHLAYILSSINTYYKKHTSLFKTEALIMNYFGMLSEQKVQKKENEREIFINFQKDFADILLKDPNERNVLQYFDLETYVDAKIKGVSMAELMQKKHAKAWDN